LPEPAERSLYEALQAVRPVFDTMYGAGDYTGALKTLAPLKMPVDAFFDGVMVNADDPKLRANRLALLNDLHVMMNKVADLSRLAA
jgi:glycyl-tRNA synthetase beta chain